jgi:hypothetical protein
MRIHSFEKHGFMIFQFQEIIHLNSSISDLENLVRNAAKAGFKFIAVSFHPESDLSSLSISSLVKCGFLLQDAGGRFVVLSPGKQIYDLVNDLELSSIIGIAENEEELEVLKNKAVE